MDSARSRPPNAPGPGSRQTPDWIARLRRPQRNNRKPRPHPSVEPNRRLLPARHGFFRYPDPEVQVPNSHTSPVHLRREFRKNALNDKKRAGCCVSRSSGLESVACRLYPARFRRRAHSLQRFYGSSTQSLPLVAFAGEVRFSAPGAWQRTPRTVEWGDRSQADA